MERLRLYPETKGNCKGELRVRWGTLNIIMSKFVAIPVVPNSYNGLMSNGILAGTGATESGARLGIITGQDVYSARIDQVGYMFSLSNFNAIAGREAIPAIMPATTVINSDSGTNVYISTLDITYGGARYFYHVSNTLIEPYPAGTSLITVINDFLNDYGETYYPIYYFTIGECTITGPLDAPSGQDCVVTVNPAPGWTFRGASGVRIVDALGEPVPFIVNGNSFSFTMPQF